jgi:hypothetical protein
MKNMKNGEGRDETQSYDVHHFCHILIPVSLEGGKVLENQLGVNLGVGEHETVRETSHLEE